ncbi:LETM1-related biofilm-associated protein [Crocinitomix catalasitica]|uniref:LETM1-related biofilm-associated protein n=1 Tax=Crocinitomix catalasitica TaxID=184607 RepID=UPI00146FB8FA|nr:LETM1-related biofilm-associated protein [Crocinitomix catalasitica]
MSPGKRGWIKKYFSILVNYKENLNRYPGALLSPEELFYAYLQPTGIMYGFPANLLFLDAKIMKGWSKDETFRVLLLEGLILVDHLKKGEFDIESLEASLGRFVEFYEKTQIERSKKSWLNFKDATVYEKLESIINQRIDIKTSFSNKLWTTYLYNSLIFHDLILYDEYHKGHDTHRIKIKREVVALELVKVVAAAAHSGYEIKEPEKAIFDVFLASADLSKSGRDQARDFWDQKKTLDDIDFKFDRSWALNRYILELAVLTVWGDRQVNEAEHQFLNDLTERLGIAEEEKDASFIAIQSFVMKNHEAVPYLTGKKDSTLLMDGATERWRNILGRNKEKLATELKDSKELLALIAKSTTEELTKEEKEKAKNQLKDLARTIPSLTLFMLPGGSLLLPIILKIIPDLVPTAFRNNQIDDEEE